MARYTTLFTTTFLSVLSSLAFSSVIFEDSFESGDLLTTNSDGFKWLAVNRTSIVRDDQYVVWNGDAIMTGPISGREWEGATGSHSMRFRYPGGTSMAEQRYELGGAYKDVWISFKLKVPINFKHMTGNSNNKLAAFWMDNYEVTNNAAGPTTVWQIRENGSGGSNTVVYYLESDTTGREWSDRHSGEQQSTPFISYPADQGRWMTIAFHLVAATDENSNDGYVQMWRKWESESSFTKLHDMQNLNNPAPNSGPNGWSKGYLMGWANAPYQYSTEFLIDDFVVSTTSLVGDDTAEEVTNSIPMPPQGLTARETAE